MATSPIASIVADFDDVWSFLKDRNIVPQNPPSEMISLAKRMHRATYSLILWRFRLSSVPIHGKVFIEEIASDALQILPHSLLGYGKTAGLLIRGVIENAIRHIYFFDHPIEFDRMNREKKWFLSIDELFRYAAILPKIQEKESRFDAVSKLSTMYSELSAGVHGRRVQDLEMKTALEKITYDASLFKKHVETVQKCTESTNFLLATFHKEKVDKFGLEDRKIVLNTMSSLARRVFGGLA